MSNTDYNWVAACGGTEQPFNYRGKSYLYMWNNATGEHKYYCRTDDLFLADEEAEKLFNR